jgi:membrane-bound lytic murein transglycosylase A
VSRRSASRLLLLGAALLASCLAAHRYPLYQPLAVLPESLPFHDDADPESLLRALDRQLVAMEKEGDLAAALPFGDRTIPRQELYDSLKLLREIYAPGFPAPQRESLIRQTFSFVRVGRSETDRRAFFTGYYLPEFEALPPAPQRPDLFPIFSPPPGLQNFALEQLDPQFGRWQLAYLIRSGKLLPLPPRPKAEQSSLPGAAVLAYLKDPIERYFLEVQGSGILLYPDRTRHFVHYAGNNGYPFVAIGRLLIEDKKMRREEVSLPAIRRYFADHPPELPLYMEKIRRMIFFNEVKEGADSFPRGSGGVALTPGRSIASDKKIFPAGAIAWICLPYPDRTDRPPKEWPKSCRLVIDQDSGGGIDGPGRIDLYAGAGPAAEEIAGHLSHWGEIYYLRKRRP